MIYLRVGTGSKLAFSNCQYAAYIWYLVFSFVFFFVIKVLSVLSIYTDEWSLYQRPSTMIEIKTAQKDIKLENNLRQKTDGIIL